MKVLLVVSRRYNGHELWTALGIINQRGHEFEVISTALEIEDEITGQRNIIKRTLDDVKNLEGFDALMFVSGNMRDTEKYWDDPRAQRYVVEAQGKDMPIAAICCSVPSIRKAAGGKRVSFFPLVRSRQRLEDAGALCQTVALTVDDKLVTAEHQMATQMWAEAFCDVLDGKTPEITLTDSGFSPLVKPRRRMAQEVTELRDLMKRTGRSGVNEIPSE